MNKGENVGFIECDAVSLKKIEDNTYDLIYMVDVIHHIVEISEMFRSIKRVLKPKGRVYIFTDTHEHIKNRLTTKYFTETLAVELDRYQSTAQLTQAMEKGDIVYHKIANYISARKR